MSNRSAWLEVAYPVCGAQPNSRCGGWHWTRGSRSVWVAGTRLHPARGWRERHCRKCGAWPDHPCLTPSGRETTRIHRARLAPARTEIVGRDEIWEELGRRGASVAVVPFGGRAGRGGETGRIVLLAHPGDGLVELESWSSRDELCYALEAPVWARFGTFVGHPQVAGEVMWLGGERAVELVATRGGRRFEERLA